MRLDELNTLEDEAAIREFRRCCGSARWAQAMTAARPFDSGETMVRVADDIWWSLGRADWLEAFAAHPRIGDRPRSAWEAGEQSGVAEGARARFEKLNRDYEARFGYIFIVCATGKTAEEMLAMLEARLTNNPETELHVAAREQQKITRLRLAKLLT